MRLDEGIEDQKLALDITPLIDIIFLLVLFFAVSTSFISGEDLAALQTDVVTLGEDREVLASEVQTQKAAITTLKSDFALMVEQKAAEIAELAQTLEASEGRSAELDFMVQSLETQQLDLRRKVESQEQRNSTLEEQLQTAFRDAQNLNAELTAMRTDAERQAENERLLRGLLDERLKERDALAEEAGELDRQKSALAAQLSMLRGFIDQNREESRAREAAAEEEKGDLAARLEETLSAVQGLTSKLAAREQALSESRSALDQRAAQEVLLQKLLADKAAQLDGLQVRLEAATAERDQAADAVARAESAARQSIEGLSAENRTLNTQLLRLQAELNKYREVDALGREQIERILAAQAQLRDGMADYLADNSLGIKQEKQRLTLQLSDKILFASGSPNLKPAGLELLRDIGTILKERMNNLDIQVGGHTDNIPVGGRRGPLADNWGLSAARAVNVVRFFESELGIEPGRIAAVGYGEHRPVGDNATPQGRAQNRRIEIVLLPR